MMDLFFSADCHVHLGVDVVVVLIGANVGSTPPLVLLVLLELLLELLLLLLLLLLLDEDTC